MEQGLPTVARHGLQARDWPTRRQRCRASHCRPARALWPRAGNEPRSGGSRQRGAVRRSRSCRSVECAFAVDRMGAVGGVEEVGVVNGVDGSLQPKLLEVGDGHGERTAVHLAKQNRSLGPRPDQESPEAVVLDLQARILRIRGQKADPPIVGLEESVDHRTDVGPVPCSFGIEDQLAKLRILLLNARAASLYFRNGRRGSLIAGRQPTSFLYSPRCFARHESLTGRRLLPERSVVSIPSASDFRSG